MAVIAFDFDHTLLDTSRFDGLRSKYQWAEIAARQRGLDFNPELLTAIAQLQGAGHTIALVSTSPYARYIRQFVDRSGIEFAAILDYDAARDLPGQPGWGNGRAAIKARELAELQRQFPGQRIVLIGDDGSDSFGAKLAGIPYVHACWASDTHDYAVACVRRPADLADVILLAGAVHLERYQLRALPKSNAGRYTYSTLDVHGIETFFLDTYHTIPCEERFVPATRALHRFKDGEPAEIVVFRDALVAIASDLQQHSLVRANCIIPTIASGSEMADSGDGVSILASAIGEAMNLPVRLDLIRQTPRESLHGRTDMPFEQRYPIVYENLEVNDSAAGLNVLLIDDVVSSGATSNAYRDRIREAGGDVAAVLAINKYYQEQELLNPWLYE